MSENGNKMDGAESSLNGQTPDDGQPRSLEDSGIYSIGELQQPSTSSASGQWQPESQASLEDSGIAKEDDKTDIGSASEEKLEKNTRDDNEGKGTLGASLKAQKPVVQDTHVPGLHAPFNDQDLVGYYAQLQRISVRIAEAKNDIARYLQDGTGNVDLSQAFQASNKIFDEMVALKRNGEELMNKFQLNSSGQGQIMKETTTFETPETIMQTELVTTKTSLPYLPQNGDKHAPTEPVAQDLPNVADLPVPMETQETSSDIPIPPMDEVHQHAPDTSGMLKSMYTTGPKGDLYVEEPSSGTTSDSADPALPAPTEKENDGNAELQNSRLSIGREQKWIQLNLVSKLLPMSECVGIIVKEHYAQGTAGEGINPPELQCIRHPWGTCFRMGSRYVLTSKHVVDMADISSNASVVFNYYHKPLPFSHFPIRGIRFSCIDPGLDYSVLELSIPSQHFQEVQQYLPGLGHLVKELGKGQKVTLIGHPNNGEPMSMDPSCPVVCSLNWYELLVNKLSKNEAFVLCHPGRALYRSTFGQGSSGSPVFNDSGYLVGMHTGGFPTDGQSLVEQMIRMTAIRAEIKLHQPDLCDDLFFSQSYLPP